MTPSFFRTYPRACAVILAASKGSRLYPMTTADIPKHLLPVGGTPSILRLLEALSSFPQIVIAIAADDSRTLPALEQVAKMLSTPDQVSTGAKDTNSDNPEIPQCWRLESNSVEGQMIYLVKLSEDCFASADGLRQVEETKLIHPATRIVLFPGDLVFLKKEINLDALIRPPTGAACVALLVDVLEQDEHGQPVKESSKAKRGGLSRDEEDIEYIGLSFPSPSWQEGTYVTSPRLPRIVLKKLKLDVEADEDMTGSTAKLTIPKPRLRCGQLVIRTEWSDVHVYSLDPWVRQLIVARTRNLSSIQEDLLPLLVARQFKGKKETFGKSVLASLTASQQEEKENDEGSSSSNHSSADSPSNTKQQHTVLDQIDDSPYSVSALTLPSKSVVRANTISSYLFACKETVANGSTLTMPEGCKWNGNFQTLIMDGTSLGAKITMKSTTVGSKCTLGERCRLSNVVIMDNVSIGENCSLQNTLIGFGATLGNNCSLNDCQVGPGMELPGGTKEKGESFVVGDVIDDEIL